MSRSNDSAVDETTSFGRPMWIAAGFLALIATLAICYPAWPGYMSYDSLKAYDQAVHGVDTMTWPPLHTYLFWLSRKLGAGAGGLFAAQTFLLFGAAGLAISLLVRSRRWALAAMAAFAVAFVAVPPMLGVAMALWRDVPTASFAVVSLTLWLLAARRRSLGLLIAAGVAVGCALALRYNAFALFVLVAPLMIWRPYLAKAAPAGARFAILVSLVVSCGLALASTQWRLPDLKRLPAAGVFAGVQEFDLIGISACAGHNYLPAAVTDGWPITVEQIQQAYDPRHLQRATRVFPGAPQIKETDGSGRVQQTWREVVPREFGCYLAHRGAVLAEQMGVVRDEVFYPVAGGVIPNPYGLKLAHPGASAAVAAYVERNAPEFWRRPALLYLLAALVTLALVLIRHRVALLATALLGGAFAYPAILFIAAPAADARYIFPSNVVCALLISAGVALLLERRTSR